MNRLRPIAIVCGLALVSCFQVDAAPEAPLETQPSASTVSPIISQGSSAERPSHDRPAGAATRTSGDDESCDPGTYAELTTISWDAIIEDPSLGWAFRDRCDYGASSCSPDSELAYYTDPDYETLSCGCECGRVDCNPGEVRILANLSIQDYMDPPLYDEFQAECYELADAICLPNESLIYDRTPEGTQVICGCECADSTCEPGDYEVLDRISWSSITAAPYVGRRFEVNCDRLSEQCQADEDFVFSMDTAGEVLECGCLCGRTECDPETFILLHSIENDFTRSEWEAFEGECDASYSDLCLPEEALTIVPSPDGSRTMCGCKCPEEGGMCEAGFTALEGDVDLGGGPIPLTIDYGTLLSHPDMFDKWDAACWQAAAECPEGTLPTATTDEFLTPESLISCGCSCGPLCDPTSLYYYGAEPADGLDDLGVFAAQCEANRPLELCPGDALVFASPTPDGETVRCACRSLECPPEEGTCEGRLERQIDVLRDYDPSDTITNASFLRGCLGASGGVCEADEEYFYEERAGSLFCGCRCVE